MHRDYGETMDVSADLYELARTPMAVVCSGVKSILDVGKTLEYLETLGVCVTTLDSSGSTEFPAFFTRKSGYHAPYNSKSELDAAQMLHAIRTRLDSSSALLVAVPVPVEFASDEQLVDDSIRKALDEAKRLNIRGKKVNNL